MINQYLKHFFRCKIAVGAWIILLGAAAFFSVNFYLVGMTSYHILYIFSRYMFYICALQSLAAWFLLGQAKTDGVDEVICAVRGNGSYQKGGLWLLGALSLFFNLAVISFLYFTAFCNDGSSYSFSYIPRAWLWNALVPQMICLLLVYVFSLEKQQILFSALLVLFLLLISPFLELTWKGKTAVWVDQVFSALRLPFTILYQNGKWSPDPQYGLQMEPARIAVQLFWLFLLGGTIWLRGNFRKKDGFRRMAAPAAFLLSAVCLVYSFLPSCLYRLSDGWDGIMYDWNYYGDSRITVQDPESVGYMISSYDLDLKFGRMLKVDGRLHITSEQPRNTFVFTLYHRYKIAKLERCFTEEKIGGQTDRGSGKGDYSGLAETGQLSFVQEGDSVTVRTEKPVCSLNLELSYEGYSSYFYSNSEAALLPGWFPWYPMAGERNLYGDYGRMEGGYNPYNRIEKAEIRLTVDASFPVTTSLEKVSADPICFEGISDGITLLGGQIRETGDGVVQNLLPFALSKTSDCSEEDFVKEQTRQYEETCNLLKKEYGIDTSGLENKKLLLAGDGLSRSGSNQYFSVFDSCILMEPHYFDTEVVLQYLIREKRNTIIFLSPLTSFCDTALETWESWIQDLEYLEDWQRQGEVPDQEDVVMISFLDTLRHASNDAEKEEMVRTVLHYFLNDSSMSEDEFIKEFRETYD